MESRVPGGIDHKTADAVRRIAVRPDADEAVTRTGLRYRRNDIATSSFAPHALPPG